MLIVSWCDLEETNEAPEISFDSRQILFDAMMISIMRSYLSKNSHTHPMKIDQTKVHAMHFMWCCWIYGALIFSDHCFSFTRDNFTLHNRWEKAAAWFERQNWFLRLWPFPIYGNRWDKRSLFERGRNKSGSSWPFLKPKVSYSGLHILPQFGLVVIEVPLTPYTRVSPIFQFLNPIFSTPMRY